VKNIMFYLISAVDHLHDCEVIHRDIKMENILLEKNLDDIKLIDFGLSTTFE